jgi:methionyl-tRNA formyltransferase
MRLVFLGTSAFACPALCALAETHDVALVITQPDRPAGRKRRLCPPAIKVAASKLGLKVAQPERINNPDGLDLLENAAPDAIVVASYGQLLRKAVFALPPLGTINIHASLLPRYRGAAPINWAIINGEQETGITTFLIDKGMDTGKVLMKETLAIGKDETAGELHDRLATLGAKVIIETLSGIEDKALVPTVQNEDGASLAPKFCREDGKIDWTQTAQEIHDRVRGMNPYPGAFTLLGKETVKIHRTLVTGIGRGDVQPGEIALKETGRLLVGTGENLIEIMEVQRECRPRVSGQDFLNGLRGEMRFG